MNLLAHAYPSHEHPHILLGNMIGDDVKGMQIRLYPPQVRAGIQLHRYIDSYTDRHPLIIEIKRIYRPAARLYAGPLIDITLDYFLANDPTVKTPEQWQTFASWAYEVLQDAAGWHVGGFRKYFPYLQNENWFIHYGEVPFIQNTLTNLLKRAGIRDAAPQILQAFTAHQQELSQVYQQFFPQLAQYSLRQLNRLLQ